MLKRSVGILIYKKDGDDYKVLLCHMGGPYWQHVDFGAWSLPKGMIAKSDGKIVDAALREFHEETGFSISREELSFLGSKRQASYKLVTVFTACHDYDASLASSNTFVKEWPKNSGCFCQFPEMDRAAWFTFSEAQEKILKGQIYFLQKLQRRLDLQGQDNV